MSDVRHQNISILLPFARLCVFTSDGETGACARTLEDDWRFARVSVHIEGGGVEKAIDTYKENDSPELIIIQTEVVDDDFLGKLEDLATYCHEDSAAIIIGPQNDVNLYRRLIDMGVSDYMVRPVQAADIAEVAARALIEKKGVGGSSLIAVIGAKGGVGASLIAQGLACGVADIHQEKAVLMDVAGGWSTLGVGLGFEPIATLQEAVSAAQAEREDDLKRMLQQCGENLRVLATGGEAMLDKFIEASQLESLIDMLMKKSPVVVVDLSCSGEDLQKIILLRASMIVLVSDANLSSLRLARTLLHEVKEVRGHNMHDVKLIINKVGAASQYEMKTADIEDAVGHEVSASVPYNVKAFLGSESSSTKLTDVKESRSIIENNILPMCDDLFAHHMQSSAQDIKKTGWFDGLFEKKK